MASKNNKANYYTNVDVDDVTLRVTTRGADTYVDIVKKTNTKSPVSVLLPRLKAVNVKLTMEGNIGELGYKKQPILKRTDARYKFGMALGGTDELTMAVFPTLKQDQVAAFGVMHKIAMNALAEIYEKRPANFMLYITKSTTAAVERELDMILTVRKEQVKTNTVVEDKTSGITTLKHVLELMEKDVVYKEKIMSYAREHFMAKASVKVPNPEDFDENGNSKDKDSNATLVVWLERKVWIRRRDTLSTPSKNIAEKKTSDLLGSTLENWPLIKEEMGDYYQSNFFKYAGPNGVIETRPKVEGKKNGAVLMHDDPSWSPLTKDQDSLIAVPLFFDCWSGASSYGIKVFPSSIISILHQTECEKSKDRIYTDAASTGIAKRKRPTDTATVAQPVKKPRLSDEEEDALAQLSHEDDGDDAMSGVDHDVVVTSIKDATSVEIMSA